MSKKKKSAYERERKRIMNYIYAQRRKGNTVVMPSIPTLRQLKKEGYTGSEITKKVNQLKKLNPSEIKKNLVIETKINDDVSMMDRTVIYGFFARLNSFPVGKGAYLIKKAVRVIIQEKGLHNMAVALQQLAIKGRLIDFFVAYDTDQAGYYMGDLLELLPNTSKMYTDTFNERWQAMVTQGEDIEFQEQWVDYDE